MLYSAIFTIMKNCDIFISAQNIYCGYSFEPPHLGDSNEYPQSMLYSRHMKMKNNVHHFILTPILQYKCIDLMTSNNLYVYMYVYVFD